MGVIPARLKKLVLELPQVPAPAAEYVSVKLVGNLICMSG